MQTRHITKPDTKMKIICLFIIVGWPLITLGSNLQKDSKDEENGGKKAIISIFIFALTYTVYYYAGIFELLTEAL